MKSIRNTIAFSGIVAAVMALHGLSLAVLQARADALFAPPTGPVQVHHPNASNVLVKDTP